jgi:hypothetical protein
MAGEMVLRLSYPESVHRVFPDSRSDGFNEFGFLGLGPSQHIVVGKVAKTGRFRFVLHDVLNQFVAVCYSLEAHFPNRVSKSLTNAVAAMYFFVSAAVGPLALGFVTRFGFGFASVPGVAALVFFAVGFFIGWAK